MSSSTFFGCEPGAHGQIVALGVPFDQGSTGPSGCASAPAVLRSLTKHLGLKQGFVWNQATRQKILSDVRLTDAGDLPYRAHISRQAYLDKIEQAVAVIAQEARKPLILGGDHLITLPVVRGLSKAHSKIQVIQIDAHTDFNRIEPEDQPTHSNFIGFLAREKSVQKIIQVGVRTLSRECVSFPEVIQNATLDQLSGSLIPGVPVYLTIDTDGFDPMLAPGVGHPVINGLQWSDLSRVLTNVRQSECPLIGADWVEYNPKLDSLNHLTGHGIMAQFPAILEALTR